MCRRCRRGHTRQGGHQKSEKVRIAYRRSQAMSFETSSDTAPISTATLGLPLLAYIQEDPLGAASCFQNRFGDVARLNILFRRIYYFFSPDAARQLLVDNQADFTRDRRGNRLNPSPSC